MELIVQYSIQSSNAGHIAQTALKVDDIAAEQATQASATDGTYQCEPIVAQQDRGVEKAVEEIDGYTRQAAKAQLFESIVTDAAKAQKVCKHGNVPNRCPIQSCAAWATESAHEDNHEGS